MSSNTEMQLHFSREPVTRRSLLSITFSTALDVRYPSHHTARAPESCHIPAIDAAPVYNTARFGGGRMHLTSKACIFFNQNLRPLLQKLHLTDGKNHAAGSLAVARAEGATVSPSSSSKRAEIAKNQPEGDAGQIPFQLDIGLIFSGRESPYCS